MRIAIFILLSLIIFSCKEDVVSDNIVPDDAFDMFLDSVYNYASEIYYWNDLISDYNYVKTKRRLSLSEYDAIFNDLINITSKAINPTTNESYEYLNETKLKYTLFLNNEMEYTSKNVGYGVVFSSFEKNDIRVQYVLNNSSAYKVGIKRGMRLLSINNIEAKTEDAFYSYLNKALSGDRIEIVLENGGTIKNANLVKDELFYDPVLKDTILNIADSKIGYISYLSFQNGFLHMKRLSDMFFKFERAHIEKLIIDLRYNQGGYVSTVDYFANRLIPFDYDGYLMRYEEYNKCMQEGKATILKNQKISISGEALTLYDYDYSISNNTIYFNKTESPIGIKQIVFIVSNITASASELLINILRPYMSIIIIGVNDGNSETIFSYGKPVGCISVNIANYTFFLPMFKNYNAIGYGDYFNGIKSDYSIYDDLTHDFADGEDVSIQKSLEVFGFINKVRVGHNKLKKYTINTINTVNLPTVLIKDDYK